MDDWKLPWEGSCRCGQVRLPISAPPLLSMACHCSGCQRMSASAYSLSLAIPGAGFRVSQGEPVIGALHAHPQHFFCPHCLSWMFSRPVGQDSFVLRRPTMLDEHAWFVPFIESFTSQMLPWAASGARLRYERFPRPEDCPPLMAEFAGVGARPTR